MRKTRVTTIEPTTTEPAPTGRRVDAAGAVELLAAARSIIVLCHLQPDAGTVGAAPVWASSSFARAGFRSLYPPPTLPESLSGLPV